MEPIAIVGMSLRFPQDATSLSAFWELLRHARSAMTEIPQDRWNVDAYYHPDTNGLDAVRLFLIALSLT